MIRGVFSAFAKNVTANLLSKSCQSKSELLSCTSKPIIRQQNANFNSLVSTAGNILQSSKFLMKFTKPLLLKPKQAPTEHVRNLIKFSLKKGKRKTVRTVPNRFFRLHWGIWIRRMAGTSRLFCKRKGRRQRLLSHVFCNATQSYMLDKMVNKFWRKPKYYLDDPYAVYHQRENFGLSRKKPWRPEGVDYE